MHIQELRKSCYVYGTEELAKPQPEYLDILERDMGI